MSTWSPVTCMPLRGASSANQSRKLCVLPVHDVKLECPFCCELILQRMNSK